MSCLIHLGDNTLEPYHFWSIVFLITKYVYRDTLHCRDISHFLSKSKFDHIFVWWGPYALCYIITEHTYIYIYTYMPISHTPMQRFPFWIVVKWIVYFSFYPLVIKHGQWNIIHWSDTRFFSARNTLTFLFILHICNVIYTSYVFQSWFSSKISAFFFT